MNKSLLTAIAGVALAFSAAAEEYTITMADVTIDDINQFVAEGFTFTTAKNDGNNAPTYNATNKDLRLYAKNTLDIAATGANITAISFEISKQGLNRFPEVTVSTGEIAKQGVTPLVWGGSAANVTFSVGEKAVYGKDGATKAGQFDFTSVTITTDGPISAPETPDIPDTPDTPDTPTAVQGIYTKAATVTDGTYLIYADDKVATPLTGNYGYLKTADATVTDGTITMDKANQFTIKAAEGGYTIQDPEGKYYYMKGTYNSFNRDAALPAEGGIWSIAPNTDGTVVIKNVLMEKTLQFDPNYNSFGAYAEVTATLPTLFVYTKDAEVTPDTPVTPELPELENLSILSDLENNTEFKVATDLTVIYSNGAYTYVTDKVSNALVYKYDLGLNAGDVIAKGWPAKFTIFNNLYEVVPTADLTVASTGAQIPEPTDIEPEDAPYFVTVSNQAAYLRLLNVKFEAETGAEKASYTGLMGESTIGFYNRFQNEVMEAGTYNVTGFVAVYKDNVQVYPVKFEKAGTSGIADIATDNAPVKYYNLQGVEVATPQAGSVYIRVQGTQATKVVR